MNRPRFSSALGYIGALAGVAIALGLPWIVLAYGTDLGPGIRATIVILALLVGALLAIGSVVVGVTIPSATSNPKMYIGTVPTDCCGPTTERPEE